MRANPPRLQTLRQAANFRFKTDQNGAFASPRTSHSTRRAFDGASSPLDPNLIRRIPRMRASGTLVLYVPAAFGFWARKARHWWIPSTFTKVQMGIKDGASRAGVGFIPDILSEQPHYWHL
jgi:hypothetical protein